VLLLALAVQRFLHVVKETAFLGEDESFFTKLIALPLVI
jgi:hypothetical protein